MNSVREIELLNQHELNSGAALNPDSSWHAVYKKSAYIFVGNLDARLTLLDVVTVFSQAGEIVDAHIVTPDTDSIRSQQQARQPAATCAFVAFEDTRSAILAIDNFNGAQLLGRTMRVDHAERFRRPRSQEEAELHSTSTQISDELLSTLKDEGDKSYRERRQLIWNEAWSLKPSRSASNATSSNKRSTFIELSDEQSTIDLDSSTNNFAQSISGDHDSSIKMQQMLAEQRERRERIRAREAAALQGAHENRQR